MLYNNAGELLQILKKANLYTEKKFGQNFLINPHIIDIIMETAEIGPRDIVIEVGPGLGILTGELIKKAGDVTTIEIDDRLIPLLETEFGTSQNLHIVHGDVLKIACPPAPYKVVANIPYYITSPIISHFLQNPPDYRPDKLVLLTQLEVARKICAKAGDHSILSLQTQVLANPKLVHQVSAGNFFPAPKVDSAILCLETRTTPLISDLETFMSLIKKAFSQKRKTMSNTLQGWQGLKKPQIETILNQAGLDPKIRPQNLDFQDWENLLEKLPKK